MLQESEASPTAPFLAEAEMDKHGFTAQERALVREFFNSSYTGGWATLNALKKRKQEGRKI